MPEAPSPEALVEIANRTYDALPAIASAFLAHAATAGLSFDRVEMPPHCKLTFDSATVVFSWCEPRYTSHGVSLESANRSFNLWFEVRGCAHLKHGDQEIYSQELRRRHGHGDDEFKGDIVAFVDTAKFVERLSPQAFGRPLKVEKL
jgi:hypothetical protein